MWWEKVGNWDERKREDMCGERENIEIREKKMDRHGWERGN